MGDGHAQRDNDGLARKMVSPYIEAVIREGSIVVVDRPANQ